MHFEVSDDAPPHWDESNENMIDSIAQKYSIWCIQIYRRHFIINVYVYPEKL